MAGLQSYPVYFDCEELDEKKKKTLQTYFQIGRKSGGGECGPITRESGLVHRVDFKDREDATAVSLNDEVIGMYNLKQGLRVTVCVGDITKQEADAFVNAANEDLRHSGGVALALSNAAGPAVQKECNDWVKNNGKVRTGDVVATSGGKLKCKKLLHVVGPKNQNASGKERVVLEETVLSALVLAESLDLRSIALPCISSGVFGVPVGVCSEAIVTAVRVFGSVEGRCMCKITLIDKKREVVESLKAACDRLLRDVLLEETVRGSVEEQTPTDDSVKVEIIQGTIENQQVSIGGMNHSTVSKAMLDAMVTAITELNPKFLSLIRIVILPQPVYDAFRAADELQKTLEEIHRMRSEQVGCDVVLDVTGVLFHVHKVILAACSDFFRGMFTSGMKESSQRGLYVIGGCYFYTKDDIMKSAYR
uniref:Macro domain-containing protein n=1 Tax=Knipowitschia caucasica TaxID=637954 RepID=A0AAV2KNC3_KNICA